MTYAEHTKVPADRSKLEIEQILKKYDASGFAYGWEQNSAIIMFVMSGRHVKFVLPLPHKEQQDMKFDGRNSRRSTSQVKAAVEQATRQRWRALVLAIKAKLECVESGITTFEDEFLAHIVLPDGQTVGSALKPKLAEAYATGKMPPLLLGASRA